MFHLKPTPLSLSKIDIILLWTGTERLSQFISDINSIHEKIKFTSEIEKDKTLYYLDVDIKISNKKQIFGIFKKPTTTEIAIQNNSC